MVEIAEIRIERVARKRRGTDLMGKAAGCGHAMG
jgi:hypothetical protein